MPSEETKKVNDKSLLHFCGEGQHFSLFEKICSTKCLPREDIFSCVNAEKSPLNQVTDGPLMFKILANVGLSSLTEETKQQVFNSICKHNLQKAMELFQDSMSTKEIIEFVKPKGTKDSVNGQAIKHADYADSRRLTQTHADFTIKHAD